MFCPRRDRKKIQPESASWERQGFSIEKKWRRRE